jgi:uncharacterized protein (TIGR02246 family)
MKASAWQRTLPLRSPPATTTQPSPDYPRRLLLLDAAGGAQEVEDRGKLALVVALQGLAPGGADGKVDLPLGVAGGLGRGDQDAPAVVGIAGARHPAGALQAVDHRCRCCRAESQPGSQLTGRARAITEDEVEAPQVGAVEPQPGGDGLVERVEALLEEPDLDRDLADLRILRLSKLYAIVLFDRRNFSKEDDMAADDRQIEALFERLKQAWTDNDGAAYGACFTEDSDYVSYDGTRAVGRAAMQEAHERLFRGVLAGSALVGELESIRHLTPGVAIVHGTGSVLMPWRSKLPRRRQSRQTLVAVRTDDGWRFAALHNSRVRPVSIPAPNSMPSRMSQLMARLGRRLGLGRATAPTDRAPCR